MRGWRLQLLDYNSTILRTGHPLAGGRIARQMHSSPPLHHGPCWHFECHATGGHHSIPSKGNDKIGGSDRIPRPTISEPTREHRNASRQTKATDPSKRDHGLRKWGCRLTTELSLTSSLPTAS